MTRNTALTVIAIALVGILVAMLYDGGGDKSPAQSFADGVNEITNDVTDKTPAEKIGDSVDDVVDEIRE